MFERVGPLRIREMHTVHNATEEKSNDHKAAEKPKEPSMATRTFYQSQLARRNSPQQQRCEFTDEKCRGAYRHGQNGVNERDYCQSGQSEAMQQSPFP